MRYANRIKMVDFQPNWASLNWVRRLNWKCRFSRKDKTISRKKTQPFCILASSKLYAKGERNKVLKPCQRNLILLDLSGRLLLSFRSVNHQFTLPVKATNVNKSELLSIDNPNYCEIINKNPYLRGVYIGPIYTTDGSSV